MSLFIKRCCQFQLKLKEKLRDEEENQSINPRRESLHQELGGARAVVALVTKPLHLALGDDTDNVS